MDQRLVLIKDLSATPTFITALHNETVTRSHLILTLVNLYNPYTTKSPTFDQNDGVLDCAVCVHFADCLTFKNRVGDDSSATLIEWMIVRCQDSSSSLFVDVAIPMPDR